MQTPTFPATDRPTFTFPDSPGARVDEGDAGQPPGTVLSKRQRNATTWTKRAQLSYVAADKEYLVTVAKSPAARQAVGASFTCVGCTAKLTVAAVESYGHVLIDGALVYDAARDRVACDRVTQRELFEAEKAAAVAAAESRAQAASAELHEAQQQLQAARAAREASEAQASEVHAQAVASESAAVAEAARRLKKAEQRASKAEGEAAELQANLHVAWAEQQGLKQRLSAEELSVRRAHVVALEKEKAAKEEELGVLRTKLKSASTSAGMQKNRADKLEQSLQTAQEELKRLGTRVSELEKQEAAGGGVRVVPLQAKAGAPYDPFVAETLRRALSEGKVAEHNLPALSALFFQLHTRRLPDETNLIYEGLVHSSIERLGAMDAEDRKERNAKEPHMVALASDTGQRTRLDQYKGAMEVQLPSCLAHGLAC